VGLEGGEAVVLGGVAYGECAAGEELEGGGNGEREGDWGRAGEGGGEFADLGVGEGEG
jgi:hypothetical protein